MDAWLSDANARGIMDAAERMQFTPQKLLNLIVAVALEELAELGDDLEVIKIVRPEEAQ